jgi:uncharacterized repeat protein (TIGR01451 family)
MTRRVALVVTLVAIGTALGATPASAHRSPAGCTSNALDVTIDRAETLVRNGDTINYAVFVTNSAGAPCDITNATVQLTLPAADGTANGAVVTVATNQTYLAGYAYTRIATVPYTVAVNPGVTNAVAKGRAFGTLHSNDPDDNADITKPLGTRVTQPSITLDKVGSTNGGVGPQTVTYTYTVTNTSSTPVPLDQVRVADNLCTNVTPSGGDTNGNGTLENTEVWRFTCTTTHVDPGTYINTAVASGRSTVDGRPVVSPPDTWTVVVTAPPVPPVPPVPPAGGVKDVSVTQPACTLTTPSAPTVRAGELTTVRVRVRQGTVVSGALVKITLPGGKVLRARSNKSGIATFRVRPPKSGRLAISAEQCSDSAALSVKPARKVTARRLPRVTG